MMRLQRYPRNLALLKLITTLVTVMEETKYFKTIGKNDQELID